MNLSTGLLAAALLLVGCSNFVVEPTFRERLERGDTLFRDGKYDEAKHEYQAAAALAPSRPEPWIGRGWIEYYERRMKEAAESFERAMASAAGRTRALRGRAWVRAAEGDDEGALADLAAGERLDKTEYPITGLLYFRLQRFEQSADALRRAALRGLEGGEVSLWLYIAQRRAGRDPAQAQAELAAHRRLLDGNGWPLPLIDLFLGRIGIDSLLDAVKSGESAAIASRQCNANLFLAQWHLLREEWSEARRLLPTTGPCAEDWLVVSIVTAELARLPP